MDDVSEMLIYGSLIIVLVMLGIGFMIQYVQKIQDNACQNIGYEKATYRQDNKQCIKKGIHQLVDMECTLTQCIATPYTLQSVQIKQGEI